MTDILTRGDIVSFTVYPSAILGTKYVDVKVSAIVDYDTAKILGLDADAVHRNVYPTLPNNTTPNDPTQYYYVKLTLSNGAISVIGLPWINAATIVVKSSQSIQMQFDNLSSVDQARLIQIIQANGFNISKTSVIN